MEEQLVVGFIRAPHGITGEVKVESASGEYDHIVSLMNVTLRHVNSTEVPCGTKTKSCSVESAEIGDNCVFMKFAGIDSPEDARKFNGWEIVVPREYAYSLKKGEWYIDDLRNCSLIYENSCENSRVGPAAEAAPVEKIGTITDVLEGGAAYLFEVTLSESCTILADNIRFTASGKNRTVLVPFSEEHIGKVDIENKTVQLMHLWILE
jgi:16S rRNA processing protein RimM